MNSIVCSATVIDCHFSNKQDMMYLILIWIHNTPNFLGPMESQFLNNKCSQYIGPSPRYFGFCNFLALQKHIG